MDLRRVFHDFTAVCSSPALNSRWRAGEGIWLRTALLQFKPPLDRAALGVMGALVQLYHAMVRRQQTYGLLTSNHASLLVKIDWLHPSEPGQHVYVATMDVTRATGSAHLGRGWTLCEAMVNLAICQLERGLVSRQQVDGLNGALWKQQDSYQPAPDDDEDEEDDDDDTSGDTSGDSDDDCDGAATQRSAAVFNPEAKPTQTHHSGSGSRSGDTAAADGRRRGRDQDAPDDLVAVQSSRKKPRLSPGARASRQASSRGRNLKPRVSPRDADRIVSKQLTRLGSAKARQEFERLIHLDRVHACLPVERHEVGRLLCALFPPKRRGCVQAKQHYGYANTFPWIAFEFDLLRPRTLDCGPVPVSFNRALAATDDAVLARSMAIETRISTVGESGPFPESADDEHPPAPQAAEITCGGALLATGAASQSDGTPSIVEESSSPPSTNARSHVLEATPELDEADTSVSGASTGDKSDTSETSLSSEKGVGRLEECSLAAAAAGSSSSSSSWISCQAKKPQWLRDEVDYS